MHFCIFWPIGLAPPHRDAFTRTMDARYRIFADHFLNGLLRVAGSTFQFPWRGPFLRVCHRFFEYTIVMQRLYKHKAQANTIAHSFWLFAESVGALILFLTMIECILPLQSALTPYEHLLFQCCKLSLWTVVTSVVLILLVFACSRDCSNSLLGVLVALTAPFVAIQ